MDIGDKRVAVFACKRCGNYRQERLAIVEAGGGRTFEVLPCRAKGCEPKEAKHV